MRGVISYSGEETRTIWQSVAGISYCGLPQSRCHNHSVPQQSDSDLSRIPV